MVSCTRVSVQCFLASTAISGLVLQKDVEGLAGDVPVDRLSPEQLRRYQAWKRSRFERGPVREVSCFVCRYFSCSNPQQGRMLRSELLLLTC